MAYGKRLTVRKNTKVKGKSKKVKVRKRNSKYPTQISFLYFLLLPFTFLLCISLYLTPCTEYSPHSNTRNTCKTGATRLKCSLNCNGCYKAIFQRNPPSAQGQIVVVSQFLLPAPGRGRDVAGHKEFHLPAPGCLPHSLHLAD